MNSEFDFDLFVIGGGSGGVRVARWSAGLGARVALCEYDRMGGTCVIRGCVPKKLMVYAAHVQDELEEASGFGWEVGESHFDWSKLKQNRDQELKRLEGIYHHLLESKGVKIISGKGRVLDGHTVEVAGKKFTAERIVLAMGGTPVRPNIPGAEHGIVSNHIFNLEQRPKEITIVGGGFIAVEFACVFSTLGTKTNLVFRKKHILRGFDQDVREFLQAELAKREINILAEADLIELKKSGERCCLKTTRGELDSDYVLFATGRRPLLKGSGVEELGIELKENGGIEINQNCQTNIPSIYALGDVTNRITLTPVATTEGTYLAENLFNKKSFTMDYNNIPSAVFTIPPVGTVGLSEQDAQKQGFDIEIYRSEFRPLKHTLSGSAQRCLIKMVVEKSTQRVLGVHMVGADAPEIIQGVAIAVKAGLSKDAFDGTVGIHPTSAEEIVTMRK